MWREVAGTRIPEERGAYVLVVDSARNILVPVSRLIPRVLTLGWHLYAGSAKGLAACAPVSAGISSRQNLPTGMWIT